jgi:hypothetical protein
MKGTDGTGDNKGSRQWLSEVDTAYQDGGDESVPVSNSDISFGDDMA